MAGTEEVHRAVAKRLAAQHLGHHDPVWLFVAELRMSPAWAEATVEEAEKRLDSAFSELDLPPGDGGAWERALGPEGRDGFRRRWERWEPSRTFDDALARSRHPHYQEAERFGPEVAAPRRAGFRAFLALCLELAAADPGGEVYIPTRLFARHLCSGSVESDRKTVARWRDEAVRRGFLERLEGTTRRGAARFRWVAEREP